ncbi:MAG: hypothetical protein ACRD2J_15930 [Thermoanaerobaculia bacterium]
MTKRTRHILFSLGVVLFGAAAQAGLHLNLRLSPDRDLPGLPPTVLVDITNTGNTSVVPPGYVSLLVKGAQGTEFLAASEARGEEVSTWEELPELSPGASADLSFYASLDSPPWFVADRRLYAPGTYRLRIILSALPLTSASRIPSGAELSNEAIWIVAEPTGADAVVFDAIRNLKSAIFWSEALAEMIWDRFPASRYAAWAVPRSSDLSTHIQNLQGAIALDPDGRMADWHRYLTAHLYIQKVHSALAANQTSEALKAATEARRILEGLTRSDNLDVRSRAVEMLERDVPSQQSILDTATGRRGREDSELRPYVNCVMRDESGVHVWFGYGNSGRSNRVIPVGAANQFTPAPRDRSQPTSFEPGGHQLVFRVTVSSPAITWHLDKRAMHVKLEEVGECTPEAFEFYGRSWPDGDPI